MSSSINSGDSQAIAILLAEDNPVNRAMALRQLKHLGFTADMVTNGRDAVEAVRVRDYDLVLMDVQMPELDGDLAAQQIRAFGDRVRQPYIVAITANALTGDRERCLAAGMDDYLSKPVLVDDLRRALSMVAALPHPAPSPAGGQHDAPPTQPGPGAPQANLIDEAGLVEVLDVLGATPAEALDNLIALYQDEITPQIDALVSAVILRDRERIQQIAHRLLGGSRQLHAPALSGQCAALERSALSAAPDELLRQVAGIRSCYRATLQLMQQRA